MSKSAKDDILTKDRRTSDDYMVDVICVVMKDRAGEEMMSEISDQAEGMVLNRSLCRNKYDVKANHKRIVMTSAGMSDIVLDDEPMNEKRRKQMNE